jgi:hypothetical protein
MKILEIDHGIVGHQRRRTNSARRDPYLQCQFEECEHARCDMRLSVERSDLHNFDQPMVPGPKKRKPWK